MVLEPFSGLNDCWVLLIPRLSRALQPWAEISERLRRLSKFRIDASTDLKMRFWDLNRHYDTLRIIFSESLLQRFGIRRQWYEIDGWFNWRSAQEEAVSRFPENSRFVEVGTYLGRSLCSLGEVVERSGKRITVIGIDTCRGSGPEGWRGKDYHDSAVQQGGGTFAGALHKNVLDCGLGDKIQLIISDSVAAAQLFSDASLDWVHLDARHDYESVKADIQAWLPKIKPGGWLSGDDYNAEKWPGVVKAVEELLPRAELWSNQQWRWIVE